MTENACETAGGLGPSPIIATSIVVTDIGAAFRNKKRFERCAVKTSKDVERKSVRVGELGSLGA